MASQIPKQIVNNTIGSSGAFRWVRGIFMGGGFAYAYENEKPWWHYPTAFVAPVTYGSYHAYRNRENLTKMIGKIKEIEKH